MIYKIIFFCLFITSFFETNGQINFDKSMEYKIITKLEYDRLLLENEDKALSFVSKDRNTKQLFEYTSFNDKKIIIKKGIDSSNIIQLYNNEDSFFKSNSDIINKKFYHPLFKYRYLMNDIESHKDSLIHDLFRKLNLYYPKDVKKVNFENLNKRLNQIGYKEIYQKMYLHLILFCGEYLNTIDEMRSKWILEHNRNYPLSFQPTLVDSKGVNYYYTINISLARELQARFLGDDYATDNDINISNPFDLKLVLYNSLDYRDLKKDNNR